MARASIFHYPNEIAKDIPFVAAEEVGRLPIWDQRVRAYLDKWDPSRFVHRWGTPMLVSALEPARKTALLTQ